jgi:uracil-DNA glycosylase family 4
MSNKHEAANCKECPFRANSYVPPDFNGHSNGTAKFVLVGESPGHADIRQGKPFMGMAGKLLDAVLEETNVDRKHAVLTNAVLCRPNMGEVSNPQAVACCKPALDDVIEKANPEYVVTFGSGAARAMYGKEVKILTERVGPAKVVDGKPYKYLPTVNPAACLRNPNLFPRLVDDINKLKPQAYIKWQPPEYRDYDDTSKAKQVITQLLNKSGIGQIVVDLEVGEDKDESFGHPNTLLCAGVCYDAGKSVVIGRQALQSREVRDLFSLLLKTKTSIYHNGKYDVGVLYRMGFGKLPVGKDTMLMSYTQNEMSGFHSLDYIGREKLGTPDWKGVLWEWNNGKKGKWDDIPSDILYKYNAYDVAVTWDVMKMFESQMDSDDHKLHDYLCWASDELAVIESDGVLLDEGSLQTLDVEMTQELVGYKSLIQEYAGKHYEDLDSNTKRLIANGGGFNPNSHEQVKGLLQCLLGAKLTTTDADTLTFISEKYDGEIKQVADYMLLWRSVGKMHGTYVKGWMERMDDNGRIHPTYLLHGTETGRTSARNPNVQNPPRGVFRRNIIADKGNALIYADFGNIEGRIVAVLAPGNNMLNILRDPDRDIHSEVAKLIYGSDFTKEQRVIAKSVVHGKNYARTPEGIAEGLGITIAEATKVSKAYDKLVPEVKMWHKQMKDRILNDGEPLITPWGRKRRFGLITRDNQEDVFKEGLAFQPQSIGSDICLTAGIRANKLGIPVRILIHDGILVECPRDNVNEVAKELEEIMIQSGREFTDEVPFPVDVQIGTNWAEVD